jgi:hypothetical protein
MGELARESAREWSSGDDNGPMIRPAREGAYEWTDRDDDVQAALEPSPGDNPTIVAALSLITNERASVGPGSMGIYIDHAQAQEIIDWLQARLDDG